MKSLEELEMELDNAQFELDNITIKKEGNVPFRPGQTDSWKSDSYSYNIYTDPRRARYLQSKINNLESKIKNYAKTAARHIEFQEKKENELKKATENIVINTAKAIYDQKMNEYMNLNFWGKAKLLFSGKKPKILNQQEVIKTYGTQAVEQITSPAIEELLRQKEEQLKTAKVAFADDPAMIEVAIRETEKYFNNEIEKVIQAYDRALNNVNGGRSR